MSKTNLRRFAPWTWVAAGGGGRGTMASSFHAPQECCSCPKDSTHRRTGRRRPTGGPLLLVGGPIPLGARPPLAGTSGWRTSTSMPPFFLRPRRRPIRPIRRTRPTLHTHPTTLVSPTIRTPPRRLPGEVRFPPEIPATLTGARTLPTKPFPACRGVPRGEGTALARTQRRPSRRVRSSGLRIIPGRRMPRPAPLSRPVPRQSLRARGSRPRALPEADSLSSPEGETSRPGAKPPQTAVPPRVPSRRRRPTRRQARNIPLPRLAHGNSNLAARSRRLLRGKRALTPSSLRGNPPSARGGLRSIRDRQAPGSQSPVAVSRSHVRLSRRLA